LKKLILITSISLFLAFFVSSEAQEQDYNTLFQKFQTYYNSGDFLNAEKTLTSVFESNDSIKKNLLIGVYNNLGIVSLLLGNFDKALEYNFKAESLVSKDDQKSQDLADIYNNR
jgi:tetratricopeptide (TPR) repeat protein